MTVQEIIKRMRYRIQTASEVIGKGADGKAFEDMELAIQALEEVEQYRALGTPTQILERIGGLDVELGKYACIGTVEELKEAKEKQNRWKKTDKFNRMIEAFECDFNLIEESEKTFAELDELMKDTRCSLSEHMDLMQELSYLIRYEKAEIIVRSEEDELSR